MAKPKKQKEISFNAIIPLVSSPEEAAEIEQIQKWLKSHKISGATIAREQNTSTDEAHFYINVQGAVSLAAKLGDI